VIDRVDLVDRAVEQFCQRISPVIELDVQCRILTNTQANTVALLVLCMYVTDDTMKIPIFCGTLNINTDRWPILIFPCHSVVG